MRPGFSCRRSIASFGGITGTYKIERFLSQPFFVAEVFTGSPGKFVSLRDTVNFTEILVDQKTGKEVSAISKNQWRCWVMAFEIEGIYTVKNLSKYEYYRTEMGRYRYGRMQANDFCYFKTSTNYILRKTLSGTCPWADCALSVDLSLPVYLFLVLLDRVEEEEHLCGHSLGQACPLNPWVKSLWRDTTGNISHVRRGRSILTWAGPIADPEGRWPRISSSIAPRSGQF